MFIAHLPAGYLLTKALPPDRKKGSLLFTGLFFAVAPDLDIFWFYLVSSRQIPHHQYVTHWPLLWVAIFSFALLVSFVLRKPSVKPYLGIGFAAVMLHLILDSIAAEIYWLAPFSDKYINLVHVPARYSWWVYNFVLHWTFIIEALICLTAAVVLILSARKKRRNTL